MKFIKTNDITIINQFRTALYQQFVAPIDAMWELLHIASSQSYLIESENQRMGYCCIDEGKSLTQIYLDKANNYLMSTAIDALIEAKLINSAKLSSIEPVSFNACLGRSTSIKTNTYCYQYAGKTLESKPVLEINQATTEDIDKVQTFLKNQIGFDDTFGYVANLVNRKEQYIAQEGETIIATGECRLSDTQSEVADVGMIVNKDYQKKGIGTRMLAALIKKAEATKRKPICSTTHDNVASQKAIARAGFYCSHIIFDIGF